MKTIKPALTHFWQDLSPIGKGLVILTLLFFTTIFVVQFWIVNEESRERRRYRSLVEKNAETLDRICRREPALCAAEIEK